jgi:hypothetical protein
MVHTNTELIAMEKQQIHNYIRETHSFRFGRLQEEIVNVEEAWMLNISHRVLLSVSHEQPGKFVLFIALHLSLEQRHSDQTSVAY